MNHVKETLETNSTYPDWRSVSPKQTELNNALLARAGGKVKDLLSWLLADEEIDHYHSWANVVSVRRLGYNDHGPVHARISTYNALKILRLLNKAGCPPSLVKEEIGQMEDSQVAVVLGCFLHDLGMGVTREQHEWHSIQLADDIIRRYLARLYPDGDPLRAVLRAMTHEIIVGHMAKVRIHSVEAGVVLVADGTDMSKGRSRVPALLSNDPVVGDIHRYSANAIARVDIEAGDTKPVLITVNMTDTSGLFQVEEVLMTKVKASPIMGELVVRAIVNDQPPRYYLK